MSAIKGEAPRFRLRIDRPDRAPAWICMVADRRDAARETGVAAEAYAASRVTIEATRATLSGRYRNATFVIEEAS